MKTLLGMALMLALVGCATNKANMTQQVEYACSGVTSSVQVLTVAAQNKKLSDTDVVAVNKAIAITTPVCSAQEVPTMDSIKMQAFQQAAEFLGSKAAEVTK